MTEWKCVNDLDFNRRVLLFNVNIFIGKKILIKPSFFSKKIFVAYELDSGGIMHCDFTHAMPRFWAEIPKIKTGLI
jgi:hypothetical protein